MERGECEACGLQIYTLKLVADEIEACHLETLELQNSVKRL